MQTETKRKFLKDLSEVLDKHNVTLEVITTQGYDKASAELVFNIYDTQDQERYEPHAVTLADSIFDSAELDSIFINKLMVQTHRNEKKI